MIKEADDDVSGKSSRRNFLKKVGVSVSAISVAGVAGTSIIAASSKGSKSGNKAQTSYNLTENLWKLIMMI